MEPEDVEIHFGLGTIYELMEKPKQAIKQYRIALDKDDKYIPAYMRIGKLYLKTAQLDIAEEIYTKLLDLGLDNTEVHLYLGEVYFKREMYATAVYEYRKVLKLDPKNSQALYRIGLCNYGRVYKQAVEKWKLTLESSKDEKEIEMARRNLELAMEWGRALGGNLDSKLKIVISSND